MFNLFGTDKKKIKLTIHNGHRNAPNGQTGGSGVASTGVQINEVDLIDQIYYKIKARIDADKFLSSVITLAYDDAYVRNGADSDYFVALHVDGASDPTARGGFIDNDTNDQVYDQSFKFGKSVADSFFPNIGIPYVNRQTPNTSKYYAFQYTGVQTKQFIIELGFISNREDLDKLIQYDIVADLILQGMKSYWEAYDETYRYMKSQITGGDDRDKKIVELERLVVELREQNKVLLANGNGEVLKMLQDKKRSIQSKLQEALSYIDSVKI